MVCQLIAEPDFSGTVQRAMPHVKAKITVVLTAVAKLEFTFYTPTFANMAVSAAKNAESNAYICHISFFNEFFAP